MVKRTAHNGRDGGSNPPGTISIFSMRWLLVLFLFFIVLPYEYIGINEDFLFLISFAIFFYNLVNAISSLLYAELESRRNFIRSLIELSMDFRRSQLLRLLATFEYLKSQDLEVGFLNSAYLLFSQLNYRFYWNEYLTGFILGSSNLDELEHAFVQVNLNIEAEETSYQFFSA